MINKRHEDHTPRELAWFLDLCIVGIKRKINYQRGSSGYLEEGINTRLQFLSSSNKVGYKNIQSEFRLYWKLVKCTLSQLY